MGVWWEESVLCDMSLLQEPGQYKEERDKE